jgi:simple sugar transport system ATP-binding protein
MTEQKNKFLELRGVSKHFAGIAAINDVSFDVAGGEVICLLGDNGAGKSTLIKVMSGVHRPTHGELFMDSERVEFGSPRVARAAGIATVHQDVGVIPLMSVARNFFLGAEPTRGKGPGPRFLKPMDSATANGIALEQIHALGITRVQDGSQLVGTMSGGEKQALAIGRAMYFGARVLILDEPTSALGVKESEIVLRLVMKAKARGVAVVFITHNVTHAMTVGDRYIVLIHGEVAADFRRGEKRREEILDLMAGGEQLKELAMEIEHVQPEDLRLDTEELRTTVKGASDAP